MSAPKDLFSKTARAYAAYRPHYPDDLIRFVVSLCRERSCAWDAATGNGQAALMLAPYFERVIATDLSAQQIAHAPKCANINYYVATAEASGIAATSIDLITVAQAFHWFDHNAFAHEVKRIAKDGAILAVWCYALMRISDDVDAIIKQFYYDVLGAYWEPERQLVESNYAGIILPFTKISSPSFAMTSEWQLSHVLGYLGTWSALQKYRASHNDDPLARLVPSLTNAFGAIGTRRVTWIITPKIWRV